MLFNGIWFVFEITGLRKFNLTIIGMLGIIGIMKAMKNFSLDIQSILKLQELAEKVTNSNLSKCLDLLIEEAYERYRAEATERIMASRNAIGIE